MRISEYRDLIDEVWDIRNSYVSAATDSERHKEAIRLQKAIAELESARSTCHPNVYERDHAQNVIERCKRLLTEGKP